MIDIERVEGFYFVGTGGIGMSALALYYAEKGFIVAGYDRTQTLITSSLQEHGCEISFNDDPITIPAFFTDRNNVSRIAVVYTPAIPAENRILSYFRDNGFRMFKRSDLLGMLSGQTDTIAVAGTHGKTTVSAMTAHLLQQSSIGCSAFLGGISKNYNSNLITGNSNYTVMEADEYDRSFHRLKPLIAVVTALDPDHLEVYGDHAAMIDAYNEFFRKIRPSGTLICNYRIREKASLPAGIKLFTYGNETEADYSYFNVRKQQGQYVFNLKTPDRILSDIVFSFPGIINIENLTAAVAAALHCGVTERELRKASASFTGVRRRFDIRINRPGLTYIDDYAHHPEEIRTFIASVREYFGERRTTAIFQPHLFTRTRDHADGFAAVLDTLDEVIILPVYPAREKPIPGITSGMILDRMKLVSKRLMKMEEIPESIDPARTDLIMTIGAGDIDRLVGPLEKRLGKEVQA
ncbi:MAG TPA: UDP-N-acetylmuramate--L-alanine ligase [Bacteroidales bacterium]|nr:UDP-N-acetylmuramate--L-alanine ligase [Bacteroidales bacterium]HPJ58110.1 UDP-N-acetylmuramate--L-alanine ligase [Bacteroidales bacterium]HPR12455.1 UDP-N-acetylmuramate--L-alanine ligase [Bacteroidales bacterium]HRW84520.1 UDP-N-acetylmuramate--L-alanine ligase [Bacteroidales bacterium]